MIPDKASMQTVTEYLESVLEAADVPMKLQSKMGIAADEIWSNVINYSDATYGDVFCEVKNGQIIAVFKDNGKPFNPLAHDTDISLALEEDTTGGLGIFMAKQLMTKIEYLYDNGWNTITLTLNLC